MKAAGHIVTHCVCTNVVLSVQDSTGGDLWKQERTCTAVFLWHGPGSTVASTVWFICEHVREVIKTTASSCDCCGKTCSLATEAVHLWGEVKRWNSLHVLDFPILVIPLFVSPSYSIYISVSSVSSTSVQIHNHLFATVLPPHSLPLLSLYIFLFPLREVRRRCSHAHTDTNRKAPQLKEIKDNYTKGFQTRPLGTPINCFFQRSLKLILVSMI